MQRHELRRAVCANLNRNDLLVALFDLIFELGLIRLRHGFEQLLLLTILLVVRLTISRRSLQGLRNTAH